MKSNKNRKKKTGRMGNQNLAGYIFIGPFVIGFLLFTTLPMGLSLIYSFCRYDILDSPQFIGIANYVEMFTADEKFWKVFKVTLYYVFFSVPLRLAMALLIAVLLVKNTKLTGFYRALFYLPSIIGGSVAVAVLWKRIFSSEGLLNSMLQMIGIDCTMPWLGTAPYAMWTLIILAVWQFGSSMLIFLSGLKQVPVALYDAATVDGANWTQRFFKISLPMLTPSIFFNLVNQLIAGFMAFTQSYIITSGKPRDTTLFYAVYMYTNSFNYSRLGYGCAMAWFMVVFIACLTLILFKTQKYWVFYEAD